MMQMARTDSGVGSRLAVPSGSLWQKKTNANLCRAGKSSWSRRVSVDRKSAKLGGYSVLVVREIGSNRLIPYELGRVRGARPNHDVLSMV
jgi:hypothetical protein